MDGVREGVIGVAEINADASFLDVSLSFDG